MKKEQVTPLCSGGQGTKMDWFKRGISSHGDLVHCCLHCCHKYKHHICVILLLDFFKIDLMKDVMSYAEKMGWARHKAWAPQFCLEKSDSKALFSPRNFLLFFLPFIKKSFPPCYHTHQAHFHPPPSKSNSKMMSLQLTEGFNQKAATWGSERMSLKSTSPKNGYSGIFMG